MRSFAGYRLAGFCPMMSVDTFEQRVGRAIGPVERVAAFAGWR